jgi:hypothetical protein
MPIRDPIVPRPRGCRRRRSGGRCSCPVRGSCNWPAGAASTCPRSWSSSGNRAWPCPRVAAPATRASPWNEGPPRIPGGRSPARRAYAPGAGARRHSPPPRSSARSLAEASTAGSGTGWILTNSRVRGDPDTPWGLGDVDDAARGLVFDLMVELCDHAEARGMSEVSQRLEEALDALVAWEGGGGGAVPVGQGRDGGAAAAPRAARTAADLRRLRPRMESVWESYGFHTDADLTGR